MSPLKVTGVIPVYNHEHAVPAVAANLRAQGLPVVLVDDGSDESCRLALRRLLQLMRGPQVFEGRVILT